MILLVFERAEKIYSGLEGSGGNLDGRPLDRDVFLCAQLDGGGIFRRGHSCDGLKPAGKIMDGGEPKRVCNLCEVLPALADQPFGGLNLEPAKVFHHPASRFGAKHFLQVRAADQIVLAYIIQCEAAVNIVLQIRDDFGEGVLVGLFADGGTNF